MKRLVFKEVIKMCAKSVFLATIIGVVIGIIGYINRWNSSITYSNAFFLAGCLLIIAGTSTRFAAGQQSINYRLLNSQSFREMSSSERADFIINASISVNTVVLGLLSGLLLILISAIAAHMS